MPTPKWWPPSRQPNTSGSQDDPQQEDEPVAWHSVGEKTDPDQPQTWNAAPGIHITFQPPQPPAESPAQQHEREQRARVRRWLLIHGAAAAAGWAFGLYAAMTAFLHAARNGGTAAGLALALFAYVGAELVLARFGRFVPHRLRPAATLVLRIPFATALLATALYAPRALI